MPPYNLGKVKGDGVLHEPKNIGSFYGGGGGDLKGAEDADINVSFWTDAAPVCRQTIVAAHPDLPADRAVVADMADDKAAERVVAACGDVAITSGGPPCHGMSPMNEKNHAKRKYTDMNNHVLRYLDAAIRVNARVIVLENAAALATFAKFRKLLAKAVKKLRTAGYFVSVNVVNFENYKVPGAAWLLIALSRVRGGYSLCRISKTTARQVPSSRPRTVMVATNTVPLTSNAIPRSEVDLVSASEALKQEPRPKVGRAVTSPMGLKHARNRLRGWLKKNGERKFTMKYAHAVADMSKPFSCITTAFTNPTSGRFLIKTPRGFRYLHEEEAKRLMTFPIDYPFHGTQHQRFVQIGNAIPPEFACVLFRHIVTNVVIFA